VFEPVTGRREPKGGACWFDSVEYTLCSVAKRYRELTVNETRRMEGGKQE
jgi:hypothetical protein